MRKDEDNDSLWMLIDTMSNAFGCILLIAMILAVLANYDKPTPPPPPPVVQLTPLIPTNAPPQRELLISEMGDFLYDRWLTLLGTGNPSDQKEKRALSHNVLRMQSDEADLNRRITDKRDELEKLKAELAELPKLDSRHWPKEHVSPKKTLNVFIRYNEVFFQRDVTRPDLPPNKTSLKWEPITTNTVLLSPLQGHGLSVTEGWDPALKAIRANDFFLTCWVYADSFATFNKFKQAVVASHLEYGWAPALPEDNIVVALEPAVTPLPQ